MKDFKKIFAVGLILLPFLFIECEDNRTNHNDTDCYNAICTEEFRSVFISLKHASDNTPFLLTDYKVIRLSDNKDITVNNIYLTDNEGFYPITNDTQTDLFKFRNVEVEFRGYLNNAIVVRQLFIITSDCCHISLVEGNTTIFL